MQMVCAFETAFALHVPEQALTPAQLEAVSRTGANAETNNPVNRVYLQHNTYSVVCDQSATAHRGQYPNTVASRGVRNIHLELGSPGGIISLDREPAYGLALTYVDSFFIRLAHDHWEYFSFGLTIASGCSADPSNQLHRALCGLVYATPAEFNTAEAARLQLLDAIH